MVKTVINYLLNSPYYSFIFRYREIILLWGFQDVSLLFRVKIHNGNLLKKLLAEIVVNDEVTGASSGELKTFQLPEGTWCLHTPKDHEFN